MKSTFILLSIAMLLLTACNHKENRLFWISEPNGQENDFLFMAESTHVPEIKSDSLIFFLTKEELGLAEHCTYKNFGKIHTDQKFDVYILLKQQHKTGRDYTFIIRTFDRSFKMIDSYNLASWMESDKLYCYGSIDEHLSIKKNCKNGVHNEVWQIANDGRIIAPSFDVKE